MHYNALFITSCAQNEISCTVIFLGEKCTNNSQGIDIKKKSNLTRQKFTDLVNSETFSQPSILNFFKNLARTHGRK
uniref:Uncharacterized protein n=1 Tax=Klebsiella pneumoniae TaxID=573 RepID=A0A8B0SRN9_KLEPN|nr:hypothetical protein [Klebsiella pneumoniae]